MKKQMILLAILSGMFTHAEPPLDPPAKPEPAVPALPSAPLLIATVDMREIFKQYYRTVTEQQEINIERARIQKDNNEKLATIRQIDSEIRMLMKQSEDPSLSDQKKAQVFKAYQAKYQESIMLEKERREFISRRENALNENVMQRMRKIFDEIRAVVVERAREGNYSFVLDKSGHSTSQVPVVLYAKDATDITSHVLEHLNRNAPAEFTATNSLHENAPTSDSTDVKR
jgi:outer membrane protein